MCIPQRARLGRGGLLVKRLVKGWTTVFDGGPTGNSNALCDAAATDDSTRASVVGDSGAIGNYNLETGNLNDRSAPMDVTNNFNDVAVTGEGGEDNAYITGNSGKMHFSFENGEGGIWGGVTPGSGSKIGAVNCLGAHDGHIARLGPFRDGRFSSCDAVRNGRRSAAGQIGQRCVTTKTRGQGAERSPE